jgi:hypothetical protein
MPWPTASIPLGFWGAVVIIPKRNVLRRQAQNLRRVAAFAPYEERNHIQCRIVVTGMRKEKCKGDEHNELPVDRLGGRYSVNSPQQSNPKQLYSVKTHTTSNYRYRRHMGKGCDTLRKSICHNKNLRERVCKYRLLVRLTVTC